MVDAAITGAAGFDVAVEFLAAEDKIEGDGGVGEEDEAEGPGDGGLASAGEEDGVDGEGDAGDMQDGDNNPEQF